MWRVQSCGDFIHRVACGVFQSCDDLIHRVACGVFQYCRDLIHRVACGVFQSCDDFKVCDCTPAKDCFAYNQTYSLSNCLMMVEKENLATETINVTADVTNMAGLVTRIHMLVRHRAVSL